MTNKKLKSSVLTEVNVIKKLTKPLPEEAMDSPTQVSLLQALLEFYDSRQVLTTKYKKNGSYKK